MRIAIVRRECSLKKAGAERYCVNLFRGLQRLGHDVTVVGERIDEDLAGEVNFLPVPVNRLTSMTRNRSFAENCRHVLATQRFDIAHGLSRAEGLDTYRLTDPLQTHWIRVFYRRPWAQWFQHWNPRHRTILGIERQLYSPNGPRRIITQSRLDARLLQTYFGIPDERMRQVYNGVDLQTFRPVSVEERRSIREKLDIAVDRPVLVFASMDFRRKGLSTLFDALTKLRRFDPLLLVLGQGDVAGYRRRAEQLGVNQQVRFLGRQSAMPRFYSAGDLFVLPTIYEPFPNVNLEAMACGLPVVTTETCGSADIIREGENGYLIPDAWAVELLAERIASHLSLSTSERQAMSASCVATAARFPMERNAQETVAVFEDVLREKFRI